MAKEKKSSMSMDDFIKNINAEFGDNTIISPDSEPLDIEKISSGSLSLDSALGGGFPVGRIIELYGGNSSGKSSLCLQAISEIQKTGGKVAYIDTEHAMDLTYAEKLGVNTKELYFSQPDKGAETVFTVIERALVKSSDRSVFDSTILIPRSRAIIGAFT